MEVNIVTRKYNQVWLLNLNYFPQELSSVEIGAAIELTLQHISTPSQHPIPIVHICNLTTSDGNKIKTNYDKKTYFMYTYTSKNREKHIHINVKWIYLHFGKENEQLYMFHFRSVLHNGIKTEDTDVESTLAENQEQKEILW